MKKGTIRFLPMCILVAFAALALFGSLPVQALPAAFTLQIEDAARPGQCLAISNSSLVLSQSCDINNLTTWWTFLAIPGTNRTVFEIKNAGQSQFALYQDPDYTIVASANHTEIQEQWQVNGTTPSTITSITSMSDNQPIGIQPSIGVIAAVGPGSAVASPQVIRLSKVVVHVKK